MSDHEIRSFCASCFKKTPPTSCPRCSDDSNAQRVTAVAWPASRNVKKWIRVRPPPPDPYTAASYTACTANPCPRGEACPHAHTKPPDVEIWYWNRIAPLPRAQRKTQEKDKDADGDGEPQQALQKLLDYIMGFETFPPPPSELDSLSSMVESAVFYHPALNRTLAPFGWNGRLRKFETAMNLIGGDAHTRFVDAVLAGGTGEAGAAEEEATAAAAAAAASNSASSASNSAAGPPKGAYYAKYPRLVELRNRLLAVFGDRAEMHGGNIMTQYTHKFREHLRPSDYVDDEQVRFKDLLLMMPDAFTATTSSGGHMVVYKVASAPAEPPKKTQYKFRPPPPHPGPFRLCRLYPNCRFAASCLFAHGKEEWNEWMDRVGSPKTSGGAPGAAEKAERSDKATSQPASRTTTAPAAATSTGPARSATMPAANITTTAANSGSSSISSAPGWVCANVSCRARNGENHSTCARCHTRRPTVEFVRPKQLHQQVQAYILSNDISDEQLRELPTGMEVSVVCTAAGRVNVDSSTATIDPLYRALDGDKVIAVEQGSEPPCWTLRVRSASQQRCHRIGLLYPDRKGWTVDRVFLTEINHARRAVKASVDGAQECAVDLPFGPVGNRPGSSQSIEIEVSCRQTTNSTAQFVLLDCFRFVVAVKLGFVAAIRPAEVTALHAEALEEFLEVVGRSLGVGLGCEEMRDPTPDPPPPKLSGGVQLLDVRSALSAGINPNCRLADGQYLLMHAIANGASAAVILTLLQAGASARVRDSTGVTPLHIAAADQSDEIVQILLNVGAEINARTDDGWTPLAMAGVNMNWTTVALLVRQGALINELDPEGYNLLHRAAASGDSAAIDFLVSLGARPDVVNREGNRALDLAQALDHAAAAAQLGALAPLGGSGAAQTLSSGLVFDEGLEDPEEVFKLIPLGLGLSVEDGLAGDLLGGGDSGGWGLSLDSGAGLGTWGAAVDSSSERLGGDGVGGMSDQFQPAGQPGYDEMEQLMVSDIAAFERSLLLTGLEDDPLRDEASGATLLHAAAIHNVPAAVDAILQSGVSPLETNHAGATALHLAAEEGYDGFVQRLLSQASVNLSALLAATDSQGRTGLHVAAQQGRDLVVAALISKRADLERKDREGNTALHLAAQSGQVGAAMLLLEARCNPNASNARGSAPLHVALEAHQQEVAIILLSHGADMTQRDAAGNTSLHLAAQSDLRLVIRQLKSMCLDVRLTNRAGLKPHEVARAAGLAHLEFYLHPARFECANCRRWLLGTIINQCSACFSRSYCNAECQMADWRNKHAAECASLTQVRLQMTQNDTLEV